MRDLLLKRCDILVIRWWSDLPQLCGTLIISMKFKFQKLQQTFYWEHVFTYPVLQFGDIYGCPKALGFCTRLRECGVETSRGDDGVLHHEDPLAVSLSVSVYRYFC